MATRTRRLIFAALIVVCAVMIIPFVRQSTFTPPSLVDAFPYGELRIGTDPSLPPFAYFEGEDLAGFDIALGRAIADEIGLEVRFVPMGFDGLYASLIADQVDIVISALRINPTRLNEIAYSHPYFDNGLLLVDGADTEIRQMQDLPNYSVAYEFGSLADSEARYWLRRLQPFELLPYELPNYALDAVRLDEADSALIDATTYYLYHNDYPNWHSEAHQATHDFYAIATRGDKIATLTWINTALDTLINRGELQVMIERWF